jgi:hypothetical protein
MYSPMPNVMYQIGSVGKTERAQSAHRTLYADINVHACMNWGIVVDRDFRV